MLSGILFINTKGELIISRFYRDDIRHAADVFKLEVLNAVDASAGSGAAPVRYINDDSYMYIRHKDMYVVAITKKNSNAVMIFQYLYELLEVLKAYFGNEFDEDKLRDNFVLVYELLDETMDYGYPQLVTPDVLKEFIKIGSVKDEYQPKSAGGVNQPITTMITGTCDWRPEGKYKYRKNEVFLDVLESINLLMSSQGAVLRTDVAGKIVMKCFLTGMPECKFGLNDKLMLDNKSSTSNNSGSVAASNSAAGSGIAIDDIVFHRCVRLGKFEADRTISFVPPDGEFELMKYRITQNIYLPFSVIPVITEHGRTRIEYEIKVKANFTDKLFANNVVVRVPTPKNAAKYKYTAGSGTLEYLPTEHCLEWKIERFAGNTSLVLKAEVNMTASIKEKAWSRPPITMDFQVPMYTSSGLHVRFLKVFEKSNYQTIKWVRYITKAGRYEIRI